MLASAAPVRRIRRPILRQVRLATGLVLAAFVLEHLLNLALGNISLSAMEAGRAAQSAIWRNPVGDVLLYGSFAIHAALGFYAVYARRHFRLGIAEGAQLLIGVTIPLLLIPHVVDTRLGNSLFGLQATYTWEVYKFWIAFPLTGLRQSALALMVWIHLWLGLRQALRLRAFYPALRTPLLLFAVLVPVLAGLGGWQATRAVSVRIAAPDWRADAFASSHMGDDSERSALAEITDFSLLLALGCLAAAVIARLGWRYRELNRGRIAIAFADRTVRAPRGLSLLEIALLHRIPIAHVCGGRGRCSTCRVRVVGDAASPPRPSEAEQAVLLRVHAGPGVRLACQMRPVQDIAVAPLFAPAIGAEAVRSPRPAQFGAEKFLTFLFVDMRGSTELAERRLPFDAVFIINRFLQAVSSAALAAGGAPNQILGDGMLILFGLEAQPAVAARQAIECCWRIAENVAALNVSLGPDLNRPIRFGVGVHCGPAVVGDIGYERHTAFTAIGDAVNVAARLQDLSKTFAAEAVLSETVCLEAGWPLEGLASVEVETRGRSERLKVRYAASALDLKTAAAALRSR